jgi:hypothetical protein
MAFFKISYEVGILICVFAILIGSQILAIHVEHWLSRAKRQHSQKSSKL